MTKESEARVRDELLQALYTATLRCSLARASHGVLRRVQVSDGIAAGVLNILKSESASKIKARRDLGNAANDQAKKAAGKDVRDLLLLPRHGAAAFRVLRGVAAEPGRASALSDPAAGVLTLPAMPAAAVAYTLGVAQAAQSAHPGTLVCVVLPASMPFAPRPAPRRSNSRATGVLSTRPPAARTTAGSAMPSSWAEAGAYAARLALPLLFVTDQAAPTRQAGSREAHRVPAPRFPTMPVDREDPLAVYRVAFESALRAREGGGPSHLAGVPFHVPGSPPESLRALARLEAALRKRGLFQKAWRRQLEHQLVRELAGDSAE